MTDRRRNWLHVFGLLTSIKKNIPPNSPAHAKISELRSVLRDIKREEEI
jgi:hypothetical protein